MTIKDTLTQYAWSLYVSAGYPKRNHRAKQRRAYQIACVRMIAALEGK